LLALVAAVSGLATATSLLAAAGILALSVVSARKGRRATVVILNTCALFLITVVGLEMARIVVQREAGGVPTRLVYSYDQALADPEGFRRWWVTKHRAFVTNRSAFLTDDPTGEQPYLLAPGSTATVNEVVVRINRLGFRGPEIELEKGDSYRIVALGESTTFGLLLLAGDRPWPEVLEELIARELECDKRVQVINAGVPGWSIGSNLKRLRRDIFPLHPDMIISYHGYNGFSFIIRELPPVLIEEAPWPAPRPSKLLEDAEGALRLWWFSRRYRAARRVDYAALDSESAGAVYAGAYRRLVAADLSEGIQTVLCTFNMAVNDRSPEEAIRFYERVFPDVRARLLANRIHTRVVEKVGRLDGAVAVDTSAGLDGAYRDAYVDVIHFNQAGRDRLARNILRGILPLLQSDPDLRCRRRGGQDRLS
jgi:lysophospholipase L1-like esterase